MDQQDTYQLQHEIESIYRLYAGLANDLDPETGLGGKLLFVAENAETAIHLLRAANIAGAASLAASSDAAALRRAMRQGALDFVVTTLDEALRILKNEVRKKQPVAVGVTLAPDLIARKMIERGVQPDLLAPATPESQTFISRGARILEGQAFPSDQYLAILPIPGVGDQALRDFEDSLLKTLAPDDHINRRWMRLSARYLPSGARKFRSVLSAK